MDTPNDERTVIAAIGPEDAYSPDLPENQVIGFPKVDDEVSEWSLETRGDGWSYGSIKLAKNGFRYTMYQVRLGPAPDFTVDLDADQALLERLNPDIDFTGDFPVAKNVAETSAPPPTCLDGPAEEPKTPRPRRIRPPHPDNRREKRPNPRTFEGEIEESLPTDSESRKAIPMARGLLDYFPAALAEVAALSHAANEKHNPGEEMHWARGKSKDHADCLLRHLVERGNVDEEDGFSHTVKVAWRALALLQEELEEKGFPMARGAR